eukprot:CAMPEP_0202976772 /NCGR_PEP_ID=MMETSP1396-20130829/80449_1 /ASSEMBLY_ACC=CAM_ASM_000872 /TAXON_ID= /ORGANISM="Pseudokeronopsis sp., Strain Brazil" /LENGTH=85 /DNA_ID=CAMNT_0049714697 /DNA_START=45 /DNA_END=299 /DNA_ORIENTATION=+
MDKYAQVKKDRGWRYIIMLDSFMASMAFYMAVPYLWWFIQIFNGTLEFLAFLVATFAFGELLGQILGSFIYNRLPFKLCVCSSLI